MKRLIVFLDIDGVIATRDALDKVWLSYMGKSWDEVENPGEYLKSKNLTFPHTSCDDWPFDESAIHRINIFKRDMPCSVEYVISSSWRTGRTIEELDQIFVLKGLRLNKIIGKTGRKESRGAEILEWLEARKEQDTPYIVIDECSYDICNPEKEDQIDERLCIQTPFKDGFNEDKLVEAFKIGHEVLKSKTI